MGILEQIKSDYDLIIWDFDGTIVNLKIDWDEFKKELAVLCDNYNIKYEETYYNYLMYTLEKNGYKEEAFRFVEKKESSADYSIIDNAIHFIKELSGKTQVVCSDNLRQTIVSILCELCIDENFDYLVCKQDVTKYKPDAEGVLKIIDHYPNIKKDRILYFGDTWKDEEITKATGLDYLHINSVINEKY